MLAYPEWSSETPLLVVPKGYMAQASNEEFAESVLEGIANLGDVKHARPALLFTVGKTKFSYEYAPRPILPSSMTAPSGVSGVVSHALAPPRTRRADTGNGALTAPPADSRP